MLPGIHLLNKACVRRGPESAVRAEALGRQTALPVTACVQVQFVQSVLSVLLVSSGKVDTAVKKGAAALSIVSGREGSGWIVNFCGESVA